MFRKKDKQETLYEVTIYLKDGLIVKEKAVDPAYYTDFLAREGYILETKDTYIHYPAGSIARIEYEKGDYFDK